MWLMSCLLFCAIDRKGKLTSNPVIVIRLQPNSPIHPEAQFLPLPVQFFTDGWHISSWAEKPLSASSLAWDRIDFFFFLHFHLLLKEGLWIWDLDLRENPEGLAVTWSAEDEERTNGWVEGRPLPLLRKKAINIFHCIIVHITSCIPEVILFICTYEVLVRFVVISFLLLLASLLFNGLGFWKHRRCLMGWQFQSVTISGCRMG